jgi:phosphoribosyl-ATP pyrophosphohydrolase
MSQYEQLEKLGVVIAQRAANADPQSSYVAKLLSKGSSRAGKKVGEEAVEVAIASAGGNTQEVISESADLLFHLLVLWQSHGVTPAQVMAELERREGVSGIAEKKARKNA